MKNCVIDASVVAAAFFNESYAARAGELLTTKNQMLAPDLLYAELANIAWKRVQRKELSADEAVELLADMRAIPIQTVPLEDLIDPALHLALATGRTVYDCLYLALAVQNKCIMWTADQKLVNSLSKSPLQSFIMSIG